MKKFLYILSVILLNGCCDSKCEQKSCVTTADYESATDLEKKLINQIDAAIAGMNIMSRSFPMDKIAGYAAKKESPLFSNGVFIGFEENDDTDSTQNCQFCKGESAMECIKKMAGDVDIKIKKEGDCYKISW